MYTVLLVIHSIIVLFLIGVILIQRPEGDGLGGLGGGGGGGTGNLFTSRSSANIMTRTTSILATLFIVTSMVLAIMSGNQSKTSIVDQIPAIQAEGGAAGDAVPAGADETAPATAPEPSVPKPE